MRRRKSVRPSCSRSVRTLFCATSVRFTPWVGSSVATASVISCPFLCPDKAYLGITLRPLPSSDNIGHPKFAGGREIAYALRIPILSTPTPRRVRKTTECSPLPQAHSDLRAYLAEHNSLIMSASARIPHLKSGIYSDSLALCARVSGSSTPVIRI